LLGGEGFLQQFAAVSNVKNDVSWEEIIPAEEREKFEKEKDKEADQEAQQSRRCSSPGGAAVQEVQQSRRRSSPGGAAVQEAQPPAGIV
jgi:hypothetical protein